MITALKNNHLKIETKNIGAELTSIKFNNKEFLWQADETNWSNSSPILFPIVGRLKNDTYFIEDKEFSLPPHGFACKEEFKIIENNDQMIKYSLRYTENTLKIYPYKFELKINYELIENMIKVTWEVVNLDQKDIYFSIGAHPGFEIDLNKEEGYYLDFHNKQDLYSRKVRNYLIGERFLYKKNVEKLYIEPSLFENDAIILKDQVNSLSIKSNDCYEVKVDFPNFPYVGIWMPYQKGKGAPFVCIEPWQGIADSIDHNQQLSEKEGILCLREKDTYKASYSISIIKNNK